MTSDATPTDQPTVPLRHLLFMGWSRLFRSREAILRDFYVDNAQSAGIDLSHIESLPELRERLYAVSAGQPPYPDFARDETERSVIRGNRVIAVWLIVWTTFVPLAGVTWLIRAQLARLGAMNVVQTLTLLAGAAGAFVLLAVFGLIAQGLLMRPFVGFMNWWLNPVGGTAIRNQRSEERG